ncbi:D-alanine--D-alanine ligase [Patescibacteria group bacterium]|nr:D-alanine--D-alanine ligase [Patescibacteria group bacterium]
MNKKIKVAIIFGGKSAEHEVSIQSAKTIFDCIDKKKYEPVLIKIDKIGHWKFVDSTALLSDKRNKLNQKSEEHCILIPQGNGSTLSKDGFSPKKVFDVAFPVLHGPFGEDGTIQGLLKLVNIPFVGASVLGSAVGMDKDITKRLLKEADLPVVDCLVFKDYERGKINFQNVVSRLKLPFFVKPANSGSSVGISKVHNRKEFSVAIKEAFLFDNKILIEKCIVGREIECAVLGNENPKASLPGEIVTKNSHKFYSYQAKYIDEKGANLIIPADLNNIMIKKIQELAIKTFKVLNCEGMARVDFFLDNKNKLIINEINTIPGFTKFSMYPKLWETSGLSCAKLVDQLIQLAIERFKKENKLKTSYT